MQNPQTLTGRIVPAIAVAVVATLVLGAVVVTANVADGETAALPARFGVAAPAQGDAWRYNLTLHGEWTFGGEDEVQVDESMPFSLHQWVANATVRGGDGLLHDANLLHAELLAYRPLYIQDVDVVEGEGGEEDVVVEVSDSPYWREASATGWVLAGGKHYLARGGVSSEQTLRTDYGYLPPPAAIGVGASHTKSFQSFGAIEYPQDRVPCLVHNALQGINASLDEAIVLFDGCDLGGELLHVPDGLAFRAAAVETLDGVEAIRFDARQNGTEMHAWFTPAIPYPVRIAAAMPGERPAIVEEGDRDLPGDRSFVMQMTGFARGQAPLDAVDDPADRAPAPDLVPAPAQVIDLPDGPSLVAGPAEGGIAHPFPLSQAVLVAWQAPDFANLRTYLEGHPDAYVASADYFEGGRATDTSVVGQGRVWTVTFANGVDEPFTMTVAQQTYEGYTPVALRGQVQQPPTYSYDVGGYGYAPGYYGPWWEPPRFDAPLPSQLPAELGDVPSVMARWGAFDGAGLAANSWGFTYGCEADSDPCKPEVTLRAGLVRDQDDAFRGSPGALSPLPLPGDPYGNEAHIRVQRLATFEADGTATGLFVYDDREYRSSSDSTLPGDHDPITGAGAEPADPGYDVRSTEVSGLPPASLAWLPAPDEAASIGFLGIAVGFLYWIWPKLGLVGLFSRLERGELLDHPARQRLVQIVEAHPGIHFHELAQKAELANGTAVHHLRKLSDSGHINVRRSGRYTCYFPGGRVDPRAAAAAPLLKSAGARQVLEAVRARPGMSNLELAQHTGLQPSTVNYHVQRLSQAGLLAALRDGRSVRLHPSGSAGVVGDASPAAGAAA